MNAPPGSESSAIVFELPITQALREIDADGSRCLQRREREEEQQPPGRPPKRAC